MDEALGGATAALTLVAGLFFYRFWYKGHDKFFLCFAWSFWIEGLSRMVLAVSPDATEREPVFYVFRLLAYGLILVAVWQKNRGRG